MSALSNKIDFAVILTVKRANPNGDPLDGNRPRTDYDGYGEISDVCIKRKIRNRLMECGETIFVQSDDKRADEYRSLRERAKNELKDVYKNLFKKPEKKKSKDQDKGKENSEEKSKADEIFRTTACAKWFDVRAFGQVFAFSKESAKDEKKGASDNTAQEEGGDTGKKEKGAGVSIGIRGPVSLHPAFSIAKVNDRKESQQITKSVNLEKPGPEKAPDTMGMKHRVNHGVYVFYGSMNPQLATKTGFSENDAVAIKEALRTLFRNDASSARPEGSMEVHKVYWWEHNSNNGQYSSAKVHRLLDVKPNKEELKSIADYTITLSKLPGLKCEEIDGE